MSKAQTRVWVSGAICGNMWMPNSIGGFPINETVQSPYFPKVHSRYAGCSLKEILCNILTNSGGDFRNASFTEDTVIRFERTTVLGTHKRRVAVKEIAVTDIDSSLVNHDVFTCDLLGEDY